MAAKRAGRSISHMVVLFGGAVVLALLLLWAGWYALSSWAPSRDDYPLQGPIVTAESGAVNWPQLKAMGANFVYIRSSYGADQKDEMFSAHRENAMKAGLRYGVLHDYYSCMLASDQASNFVTIVPRDEKALPVAIKLDFVDRCADRPSRKSVVSELVTFINQVEKHSGNPVILQISKDFEDQYHISDAISRNIWLVESYFPPDYASRPWVMWTANSHYHIRGVERAVSWNVVSTQ